MAQDTEQALEELEQKFAAMRKAREAARKCSSHAFEREELNVFRLQAMSNKMKLQIGQLERQISDEKSKCDELKQRLGIASRVGCWFGQRPR